MLNIILSDEALGALISTAFPEELKGGNSFYQFSPRKTFNFYREWSKVDRLLKSGNPLSKPEERKVKKHLKARETLRGQTEIFFHWLGLCIYSCEKRQAKDETLRNRLKDFKKARGRLRTKIIGLAHPRKTPNGYGINKGVKTLNIT